MTPRLDSPPCSLSLVFLPRQVLNLTFSLPAVEFGGPDTRPGHEAAKSKDLQALGDRHLVADRVGGLGKKDEGY